MFVRDQDGNEVLAPVQATPFFTGIVGDLNVTDANGRRVGGGGVTSFAFNSGLKRVREDSVVVEQEHGWSLMDSTGTSSAFFAEKIEDILSDHDAMQGHAKSFGSKILGLLSSSMSAREMRLAQGLLGEITSVASNLLKSVLGDLLDIIPEYKYWPVRDATPDTSLKATQFGDGGLLENTGVASLLAYEDIDSIISFVNALTRFELVPDGKGIIDAAGNEIPNTNIRLDGQNAYLFGYQDYDPTTGWRLFPADSTAINSKCRIFDPSEFAPFLIGLWRASGSGSYQNPPIFKQRLTVLPNPWFGIAGNRQVTMVWNYTERAQCWYDALQPDVQAIIGDFQDPTSFSGFPHYTLLAHSHLPPTEINLLSGMTAWSVVNAANSQTFVELFQ